MYVIYIGSFMSCHLIETFMKLVKRTSFIKVYIERFFLSCDFSAPIDPLDWTLFSQVSCMTWLGLY